MRIISGYFKGRILKSPKNSDNIRPTTDRAKETIFNILNNRFDFSDKKCLDLFCGTGNIGLEFISRGINKCTFVDMNIKTISDNVISLDVKNKSEIIRCEAIKFLGYASKKEYDFIFADPPYNYADYELLIGKVSEFSAIFIIEHDKYFKVPGEFSSKVFLQKKTGISNFTFFDFK